AVNCGRDVVASDNERPAAHSSGRALFRRLHRQLKSSVSGRSTLVRALALSAAFAGSLMPVRCFAEHDYQLPAKATKELLPQLQSLLQQKNMSKHSLILNLKSGSGTSPAISRPSRSIPSVGGQAT